MQKPRHAPLIRQHLADKADGIPVVRLHRAIDSYAVHYAYWRGQQMTHQARLKRQRCAERQAKQVICNSRLYMAQFEDTHMIVSHDNLVRF